MITVTHPEFDHVQETVEDDQLAAWVAQGWQPPTDAPKKAHQAAAKVAKVVEQAASTPDKLVEKPNDTK